MKVTALTKRADRLLQEVVRLIWSGHCSWCRLPKEGAGHHLYGRRREDTRWEPAVVPYCCQECHNKIHDGAKEEYMAYIKEHWSTIWDAYISRQQEQIIYAWEIDDFVKARIQALLERRESL